MPLPDRCRGEPTTYVSFDHLLSPTQDAVDIHRLTRYSLKEGTLRPEAEGEFVSFAALKQEIDRAAPEREGFEFLRSVGSPPSVRARFVAWLRRRR